MNWTSIAGIFSLLIGAYLLAGPAYANRNDFWQQWSDGKAEVNAYRIKQKRYNKMRTGTMFSHLRHRAVFTIETGQG